MLASTLLAKENLTSRQGRVTIPARTERSEQMNFNPLESTIPPNPSGLKPRRNEQALLCKEVVRGARERHRILNVV